MSTRKAAKELISTGLLKAAMNPVRECRDWRPKRPSILTLAAMICLLWGGYPHFEARADGLIPTLKGIGPYASIGRTWDSNLFRIGVNRDIADVYTTLEAGFNTDLTVSRQRYLINGRLYRNSYQEFSDLDYTGGDAQALWQWAAGDLWSGTLGYSYSRRLRDFVHLDPRQLSNPTTTKDLQAEHKIVGSANRWLTDRWRGGVSGSRSDVQFDQTTAQDRVRNEGSVHLDYVTRIANVVGFQATVAKATYARAHINDYKEFAAGPTADWQITAKTKFRAEAGYKQRTFDDPGAQRDFNGITGRFTDVWKTDESHKITTAVYREISNLGDASADYAVVQGLSVEPLWQITEKLTWRALADLERRDFKTNAPVCDPDCLPPRQDRVYTFGTGVDWGIRRNVKVSLDYNHERRSSNFHPVSPSEGVEYQYRAVQLQLVAGF